MYKIFLTFIAIFLFSGCGMKNPFVKTASVYSQNVGFGEEKSSPAMYRSTMKPYCVRGKWYYPVAVEEGDTFNGKASWYGPNFHGKLTSNGERYNMYARTAASKTLPINTYVKVTNLNNGKQTVVRINDRGPFVATRIIDLSYEAAKEIGLVKNGVAPVQLEVISRDSGANRYVVNKVLKKQRVAKIEKHKNKSYFVQIAAIYQKQRAYDLKRRYQELNRKYKPFLLAKNNQYKLLIGKFATSSEAREFISKNGFRGAFVVRN